jgi:4-hydroxy-3-methylbut-2-en-1-yl diphosphate reductase
MVNMQVGDCFASAYISLCHLSYKFAIMKSFEVPVAYRSSLISAIKTKRKSEDRMKKDFSPTLLNFGTVQILLARHFGFCYGVENAIDIAFKTIEENPGKRIYLLSEMIHNPQVNADLKAKGVEFLQDNKGNQLIAFESLTADDIVLIPAFGTTLAIEKKLRDIGIQVENYNTTCPFVEKVWNRSEVIAKNNYTIIIHGKPSHEETRATFSHAAANAPALVVKDLKQAEELGQFILGEKDPAEFYHHFQGQLSEGFDFYKDLERIGVVNQTTMLASDTQEIADHLKSVIKNKYSLSEENTREHFADTRDTLCYATNDNQSAVKGMLETDADLAIVVGGYNSSNTSHLVELCEEKLPTYYISSDEKILSSSMISHYNFHEHTEKVTEGFLPVKDPVRILITSGASCPDAVVESVISRIVSFFPGAVSIDNIKQEFIA